MITGLVTPDNGMKRDPLQFSTFSPPYDTPESEFFLRNSLSFRFIIYKVGGWEMGRGGIVP